MDSDVPESTPTKKKKKNSADSDNEDEFSSLETKLKTTPRKRGGARGGQTAKYNFSSSEEEDE